MQGAQQRKMHDMLALVSASQVLQPEAIMKMLSPEVGVSCLHALLWVCSSAQPPVARLTSPGVFKLHAAFPAIVQCSHCMNEPGWHYCMSWFDDSFVRLSCAILPSMVLFGCIMLYCQAQNVLAQCASLLLAATGASWSHIGAEQSAAT